MKQIIISPIRGCESEVEVIITDSNRKNEKSYFHCPLECISLIISSNINLPF